MLFALTGTAGCADPDVTYEGIWKTACRDFWGVQIKRAGPSLYAVTFCGRTGCLPPGEWMPDTPIHGDPLYQVVSDGTIRIKRNDAGYFTYTQCDTDPAWTTQSPG